MYLSYIRIQQWLLHDVKKNEQRAMLKGLYETYLSGLTLPYTFKFKDSTFTLNRIVVCADNKGCNYKKIKTEGKSLVNKLVLYHDSAPSKRKVFNGHVNSKKYVTMFLHGEWEMNGKIGNFDARVFPSLKNSISLGVPDFRLNPLKDGTQQMIDAKILPQVRLFFDKLLNPDKKLKSKAPKVTTLAAQGGSLFENMDESGERLKYQIANFHDVMDILDDKVDTHYNSYEPTNKKQFNKVYFKPHDNKKYKTIGISNWGYVDIKGASDCVDVKRVFHKFKKVIKDNNIEKKIVFDKTVLRKLQRPKGGLKGCPKGNPEATGDGRCPDGYVPRPNKTKSVCCYKKKMTKAEAVRIHKAFYDANMTIPAELKKMLSQYIDVNAQRNVAKAKDFDIRDFSIRNGEIIYKGKKWNCMYLSKPQIRDIAKRLNTGFLLKDTKQVLCDDIRLKLLKERNRNRISPR